MFISQTTDSHFANYRFSFRFVPFRFAPFRFANYSKPKNLPSQFVFQLLPCYETSCPHPVCQAGKPEKDYTWYSGCPPLSYLPIPICDPQRPWGGKDCKVCAGHYLSAEKHLQDFNIHGNVNYSQPPSSTFKSLNGKHKNNEEIAKQLLLPTSEIEMWSNHLDKVQEARTVVLKKLQLHEKQKNNREVILSCGLHFYSLYSDSLFLSC